MARVVFLLLLAGLGFAALSVDVVRTGFGIKGDEATYVATALSVAHDGDLAWERRDLERFWQLYRSGPEGIFLKRGQFLRIRPDTTFPFLHLQSRPDQRSDRLYFGKAFAYGVIAAPFVRLAGLNGLLLFHVLLWVGCASAGYWLLQIRGGGWPSFLLSTAFFGASITPLYMVWLTPEILHVALVFFAYWLWFSRLFVSSDSGRLARFVHRPAAMWLGAVLLGVATFSKPPNMLLVVPPVILLWQERRWWRGLAVGTVTVATTAACFGANAVVSGEFNYQGGDRKTFYGSFPFQGPTARFDDLGISMSTSELGADEIREHDGVAGRFARNATYFVVGRHAGFLPYFFPGVVIVLWWLLERRRARLWQWAILAALGASVVVLLVTLPYSWAGGGGPPGNRYFLSLYPALFFLAPGISSVWPGVLSWAGGALFVAHILVNPFVSAKSPWQNTQRSVLRMLPVELTMVNDLPIMLNGSRARVPYGDDPQLLLYFLDDHTYLPEPAGIWVAGKETSEIIVRAGEPLDRLQVTLRAIAEGTVRLSAGDRVREVPLAPGVITTVSLPVRGVTTRGTHAYLLRVTTSNGAVPALIDPQSRDPRYLGVLIELKGHRPASLD